MKMLLPVLLMLATGKTILPGEVKVKTLPPESREVLDYLPRNIVIGVRRMLKPYFRIGPTRLFRSLPWKS